MSTTVIMVINVTLSRENFREAGTETNAGPY